MYLLAIVLVLGFIINFIKIIESRYLSTLFLFPIIWVKEVDAIDFWASFTFELIIRFYFNPSILFIFFAFSINDRRAIFLNKIEGFWGMVIKFEYQKISQIPPFFSYFLLLYIYIIYTSNFCEKNGGICEKFIKLQF